MIFPRPKTGAEASQQAGFALVVVLAGLAVLAALFAISSSRIVSHGLHQRGDMMLLERRADAIARLDEILGAGPEGSDALEHIALVDTGGYIDLNTGDPRLIALLIEALGLPEGAYRQYRDWRRTPHRVLRLEDFLRVTGSDPSGIALLRGLATVHSGRRGIAPDHAPLAVLELVTGTTGPRERLVAEVAQDLVTPASGVNFRAWAVSTEGHERALGVVHLPLPRAQRRILWIE